jgi:hypothetical protein
MWKLLREHKSTILLVVLLLTLAGSYMWNQYQMEATRTVDLPVTVTQTEGEDTASTALVSKTPLAAYQQKREQTRQQDMAALQTLAANDAVDQSARDQAQGELIEVVRCSESELAIEGALTGAGFAPCVAVVQRGAVTILVEKKELTQEEATTILTLAAAHSGEAPENIRVMAGNMI